MTLRSWFRHKITNMLFNKWTDPINIEPKYVQRLSKLKTQVQFLRDANFARSWVGHKWYIFKSVVIHTKEPCTMRRKYRVKDTISLVEILRKNIFCFANDLQVYCHICPAEKKFSAESSFHSHIVLCSNKTCFLESS